MSLEEGPIGKTAGALVGSAKIFATSRTEVRFCSRGGADAKWQDMRRIVRISANRVAPVSSRKGQGLEGVAKKVSGKAPSLVSLEEDQGNGIPRDWWALR